VIATHAGRETGGEQQAHSSLVVGRTRGVDELIRGEAITEQGRIAYLLKGDGVEIKLRASSNDVRELFRKTEADIKCAEPQRLRREEGCRGRGVN